MSAECLCAGNSAEGQQQQQRELLPQPRAGPGTLIPGAPIVSSGFALSLLRKAERKSMGSGLDNFGNVYCHVKIPLRIQPKSSH